MARRQTELSDQAFSLLADMIGGKVVWLANTSASARKMEYVVSGKVVDSDIVRELLDLCAIWPERFSDLDNVPFFVTKAGYDYVRQLSEVTGLSKDEIAQRIVNLLLNGIRNGT